MFFPFFAGFVGLWLFSLVFWILKIVEVAGIPDQDFKAAHTDKLVWVLIVVLAGIVGALVWQFAKRDEVLRMRGATPTAPPGWYPEAGTNGVRWWDGNQWTEHRSAPPTTA